MNDRTKIRRDLQSLLTLMVRDAMQALEECQSEFQTSEKSHNEVLYDTIAFIVAFVLHLRRSVSDRQNLLTAPHWENKPHPVKEENLTRLTTMLVVGAKESKGNLYQQALDYTKVVEYYLDSEFDIEEIPGDLKQETISGVLRRVRSAQEPAQKGSHDSGAGQIRAQAMDARQAAATRVSKPENDVDLFSDDGAEDEHSDSVDDDEPAVGAGKASRTTASKQIRKGQQSEAKGSKSRRYPFKQSKELAIVAGEYFGQFFGMDIDDELVVTVRRNDDHDGWHQFEISGVRLLA